MLTRFTVKGFKSLRDARIELGTVNVFIGANGSGKSNILEALGVMGAAAFGSVEPETLRYRGVRPGVPALYKTSLKGQDVRRVITLRAEAANRAVYRLGLDNSIAAPHMRWKIASEFLAGGKRLLITRVRREVRYHIAGKVSSVEATLHEDQTYAKLMFLMSGSMEPDAFPGARDMSGLLSDLEDYAIFALNTPALRGTASDLAREPLGLGGSGLPRAIQDLLDEAAGTLGPFDLDDVWELIEWAGGMSAVPGSEVPLSPAVPTTPLVLKFVDRFMAEGRNALSAYDASEGALYVLFLLALVSHPKAPRIFAVDNFDQALHPRLAAALTRMVTQQLLRDGTRQMLATTHNPLVLDGLDLRDDRVRLFAVERDRSGATQVQRIKVSEELLAEAERGLSLSRLWVMGRLGGVPRSI